MKDYTQKTGRINKFSKISGFKTSIQKLVAFLYTTSGLSKKEMKETVPFTNAPKGMKYFRKNLIKEMKGLYKLSNTQERN